MQQVLGQLLQVIGQLFNVLARLMGGQQQQQPGGPGQAPGGPGQAPGGPGQAPGQTPGQSPGPVGGPPPIGTGDTGNGQNIPWISQLHPAGAEFGYTNAAANCGPASMAMIARSKGYGQGLSDAQLINQLGAIGGTTGQGTSINGIVAMAQAMGQPAEIKGLPETSPQNFLSWVDSSLKSGKSIVANGDFNSQPGRTGAPSGHYIDVVGKDDNGNYIIRDPWDQSQTRMTPQQLLTYLKNNPVNHGYAVAVG
jgi:hypothetical protein